MREIVDAFVIVSTETTLTIRNPRGEVFVITLAGDPDLRIQQRVGETLTNLLAIEIKGGSDRSNQHNRIGEAEKSHQKARGDGYAEFWTIIRTTTLDMVVARIESPTTQLWLDTAQVGGQQGVDWEMFCEQVLIMLGLSATQLVS